MQDTDINIGDVLKVRQWDDMAAEYDVVGTCIYISDDETPLIACFSDDMRGLCGRKFTVSQKMKRYSYFYYASEEGIEKMSMISHGITAEMLEPFYEEEFEVATDDEIKLLFG